jgi:hypothetical protein
MALTGCIFIMDFAPQGMSAAPGTTDLIDYRSQMDAAEL